LGKRGLMLLLLLLLLLQSTGVCFFRMVQQP
jgi:hypothetical protein